jgi:hypothetical protein
MLGEIGGVVNKIIAKLCNFPATQIISYRRRLVKWLIRTAAAILLEYHCRGNKLPGSPPGQFEESGHAKPWRVSSLSAAFTPV